MLQDNDRQTHLYKDSRATTFARALGTGSAVWKERNPHSDLPLVSIEAADKEQVQLGPKNVSPL